MGVAIGALALWFILVLLVARKLSHPGAGSPGGGGLREKVRVGEKVVAVVSSRNGERRAVE